MMNAGRRVENFSKNIRLKFFLSPVEESLKKFLGLWDGRIENSRTKEG